MKTSQSLSKPATLAKPPHVPPRTCGFPGCTKKGQHRCSQCDEIYYCSEKHQEAHWKYHKKSALRLRRKSQRPSLRKEVRGKKKKQKKKKDPRKLKILDACAALGRACGRVRDFNDAKRYQERAKEGYEEQLGRESEKALDATYSLTMMTCKSEEELIEKLRDLVSRMERALAEENVVTLETLNSLGIELYENGEYEEAIKNHERCLAGQVKVLGEDRKLTLITLNIWEEFLIS